MKRNLLTICTTFVVLCGMWWTSSTMAQTTISCFPYSQTFDEWSSCGVSCGNACVAQDGWFNASDDTQDWTTWSGSTGSGSTGPSSDHTSGAGSYFYFEASSPCNGSNDTAHMETPRMDLTGLTDFTMAYWRHLYGQSMGNLHIDVRTYTGATANPWQLNVVAPFTANLNAWEADTVNLTAFVGQTIQVRFRGTSSTSFYGDMAIDDVEFYTSLTLDAALSGIDAPSGSVTPGVQNVEVSVTNWGSTTLTSATIDWELNSVAQTPFSWTGSLATATTQSNVVIGSANIPSGNSTIKAWISAPNAGIDQQPCNDTTETSLCTAFRGTFMVGAGQLFTDPLDAFNQLSVCGVDSHVVLNVMPGVYTQRVVINPIPGASDTSTITMDGGATSLVEVTNGNLATFQFDDADWITLRNMSITNTATSNGYGVMFRQNADHNTIDSCLIEVATGTTSLLSPVCWSSSETSPSGSGTNGNFNTVSNNTTVNGYYAIRVQGDFNNHQLENRIINNDIQDAYYYGIYAQYQDSIEIISNTIDHVTTNVNADGIYMLDLENFVIDGNDVSNVPDYGIYISDGNFDNPADRTALVTNNFISSTGDRALYFDDVEDVDVFHNTCFGTYGFYVNDIANVDIRNNIFVGTSLYAYFSLDAATVQPTVNLDYNIYWGLPGVTALASLGGTTYPDVVTWQTNFTFWNQNSLEGDPGFVNGFLDMHVSGPLASDVGDNTAGVIVDIDGETRPFAPSTTVDIGADEFFLPPLDAGITNLDNPFAPVSAGVQSIAVTIRNFGTDTLTSATIQWEVNAVAQLPFSWTGSLPVGASDVAVAIGSFNIPAGNTDICAWTTAPNGGVDGDNNNDSLCLSICTGLAGTYTVGVGQDYADLQLAFDDMISCGVAAAVILDVQPGNYPTNMVIPPIPGASATNTITVDGGDTSLVTVLGSNLATFRLDGADWITFKNMTIDNNATSNGYGVQFANNADHNTVDSCRVRVATGTTSLLAPISFSASPTAVSTSGQNGNYNTFSNNTLVNGYYGIRVQGDINNYQNLNRIENNVFEDIYYYNIYVQYQDSIEVVGNKLATSININGDGFYAFDIQNFIVEGNDMSNMADYGLYISDGNFDSVATRRGRVVNNFISSATDRALYFDDVNDVDVYHNTAVGTYGFYFNDVLDMDCRNNIFVGTTLPAMYSLDAFTLFPNSIIDFNVYFQTGGGNLAYGGGTNYADLPTWQAAIGAFNAASIEGDPVFPGGIADLHVVGAAANDAGDNGVGVLVDIDGDTRPQAPSTTVDIGADEYTPLANDAELISLFEPAGTVCGDSATQVWVIIRNLGQTPITSAPLTVNYAGGGLSGMLMATYTGNLPFLGQDTVLMGTLNTYGGAMSVNFDGWISLAGDQNTSNDTINPLGSVTFIPLQPQGTALSGCGTDSTTMVGGNWPGVGYGWYNTATDTVPVGTGSTFPVPSISTQPTYFLGYIGGSDSLQTTYIGGNGQAGNMFDIVGLTSVSISGFSGNFNTGAVTVEVWTRNTSYTVSPNSNVGWTQQGGGPISFTSNGNGVPTLIPGTFNVPLAAGDTLGVLVICTTGGVAYTNGTAVGTFFAGNSQIEVLQGVGRGVPAFTGSTFSPRNWNGTIYTGFTGCSTLRTPITATVGTAATVSLGADVVTCDTSAMLDAGSSAASYVWNTQDTTQMVSVNMSGTYSVETTDTAGCTANDSVDVTLNPAPVIALGADTTICDGDSIMLDAGNTGGQYLWSNSAITQMVNVPGGTYTVTVVDSNNCSNSETILISSSSFPVDLGADTTLCNGASLNLDAGAGATAYLWSTTDMTQSINVNTAGTYSVAATDSLGCDGIDSIIVNTQNTPTAAYTFNVTGAGLTYDFTYTGTAGTSYSWDFGDSSPLATGSTPSHTYAADGSFMVTLIATNDCGSDTITQSLSVVGIERGLRQESVTVYPNPNNGSFTLAFTSYDLSDVDVQIFNLQGKIVYTNQFESVSGSVEEDITVENIASGVYFVRLTSSDQVVTRKLTIE